MVFHLSWKVTCVNHHGDIFSQKPFKQCMHALWWRVASGSHNLESSIEVFESSTLREIIQDVIPFTLYENNIQSLSILSCFHFEM